MNKGGFSWRRFFGISAFKSKTARQTGIPTTDSGRKRKLGAYLFAALAIAAQKILDWIKKIFPRA